jgi:peptidoglycan hydrolase-like protein with peptidoglycan-binding domain
MIRRMTNSIVATGIVLILSGQLQAQSDAATFRAELEKMKKENPGQLRKLETDFVLATQMLLGRLGYGVGPFNGILDDKTREAIRQYQRKNGIPLSGEVIDWQLLEQTKKDWDFLEAQPLSLPSMHVHVGDWESGYFGATGTWRLLNDETASPEQVSEITCLADRKICMEARAYVFGESRGLTVALDFYDIERWDKSEIVTKPLAAACTRFVLRINKVQKTVSGTPSTVSKEGICKEVYQGDLHTKLKDGVKEWQQMFDVYRKKLDAIMVKGTLK